MSILAVLICFSSVSPHSETRWNLLKTTSAAMIHRVAGAEIFQIVFFKLTQQKPMSFNKRAGYRLSSLIYYVAVERGVMMSL